MSNMDKPPIACVAKTTCIDADVTDCLVTVLMPYMHNYLDLPVVSQV